ncbi:hypothetical protein PO587_20560 [Streptomyces gilvifuscus]|uniref:STAS domain-containing protein n=1 Tax=Streptomyces gilvifuscus TaxID=1550617 RepID=A0ABT5FWM4_9ACTN|nr:hypothetical protein [Streptomyces gilvifuscus]MDC2956861.1 hypothetical protein [Streptomyces gilvifuscus]
MTSSPNSPVGARVLEATIRTASGPQWQEQLHRLRTIASYDPETRTWHARLGALDLAGLQLLQTLFDTARVHGTEVFLTPVVVPACWDGPVFTREPTVAALLEAQADPGRPLGQLPVP